MRLPVNQVLALSALLLAGGTAATVQARPAPEVLDRTGPAADYPVVVGEPYTIGTTTWTPVDQLNYDAVGEAMVADSLVGISAAHKTLPLPSYAEVTALETGRTILVRLVERGPMANETLVALSADAARQLGIAPGRRAPVRVRRVNPPEVERASLRSGGTVPPRMDTPESLLKVLRRKLAEQSPLMPPPSVPPRMPASKPGVIASTDPDAGLAPSPRGPVKPEPAAPSPKPAAMPPKSPPPKPAVPKPATPKPTVPAAAATPPRAAFKGGSVVQVAAFSDAARARKVAAQLGGQVTQSGRFWRVRMGPFKAGGEGAQALEKARAAGYSDARIQRAD